MLWFDGWETAPELHQRCVESWQLFNSGWEVRTSSRADLPGLLGNFTPQYERLRVAMNPIAKWGGFWIPPAAESDMLRLILLMRYGGVWADSTMLCRRPMDEWLPTAAASGFFAFSPEVAALVEPWHGKELIPVMSSFIAAESTHPITMAWLQRVVDHWSTPADTRNDLGFFWVHFLFGKTVAEHGHEGNEQARDTWKKVPRVSGEYGVAGPHFWVPYEQPLRPPPTQELQRTIESEWETPMWKLTNHEVKLDTVGPETTYWRLLEATRKKAHAHASSCGSCGSSGSVGPALSLLNTRISTEVVRRLLAHGDDTGCH